MKDKLLLAFGLATVIIGTTGYILADEPFYEALISSIALLALNGEFEPSDALIEIARWLGFIFAMGVIYSIVELAVNRSAENIAVRRALRQANPVAIHGEGPYALALASNMGKSAVLSDMPKSYNAPTQVVLFPTDAETMDFFSLNSERLLQADEVYVGLNSIRPSATMHDNVFVFSMADICAQLYWEDFPVMRAENIALIGSGPYAEALLTQGLLVNIFDIRGGIDYIACGDFAEYRDTHRSLQAAIDANEDKLDFETSPWHAIIDKLAACDRIILCDQPEENIKLASALHAASVSVPIHMRADSEACLDLIGDDGTVRVFGTTDMLCTSAIIVQQAHHRAGKISDITYRVGTPECNGCERISGFPAEDILYDMPEEEQARIKAERSEAIDYRTCLSCDRFKASWSNMTDFQRRSNYAIAAHDNHKVALMKECSNDGTLPVFADLPLEERDRLQEIEHIRWCRFHYLNNWVQGMTADGKKDSQSLIHPLLVPYDELTRLDKDKDGDSYTTLALRMQACR